MSAEASPPRLFDRARVGRNLARAHTGRPDFVTTLVIEDLADRLAPVSRSFKRGAILGPDPRLLPTRLKTADAPVTLTPISTLLDVPGFEAVDPEALSLPHTDYDLLISLLDLQFVNDVPGLLARMRRHLVPDGLMIAASLGGRSLSELRQVWIEADTERAGGAFARVAPFMDVRDAGSLMQRAGFALPVTDLETHRVRYANPLALMQEIKSLGASNPMLEQPDRLASRALLLKAAEIYAERFADPDGRVPATLEILWLSGWAPDESQQKPLAPGSARTRLSDVLEDKSAPKRNS